MANKQNGPRIKLTDVQEAKRQKERELLRRKRDTANTVDVVRQRCAEVSPYSMLGVSVLGFPERVSSVRGVMNVRQASQRLVLNEPEFARLFTGGENPLGERSSWNIRATADWVLVKKFKKFKDVEDSPECYIFYEESTGKYRARLINPCVNLIEKYGFRMVNHIKNYNEGDKIPAGTILAQSTSYQSGDNEDEYNYCAGVNARCAFVIIPEVCEDAIWISDWLAERLEYTLVDPVEVRVSKNAYMMNRYGDEHLYKPFPDIGEAIQNDVLCSIRENSYVSSIYEASVDHVVDKKIFTHGGIVSDIDIYTNIDTEDAQLNYYLTQIRDWYSEIKTFCTAITRDPNQDDPSLMDIYQKADKFLSPSTWVSKEYIEDTVIKFQIRKTMGIHLGQKIVGRMGNKCVIAGIVKRELMPRTEDGRPIDMLFNALGIPNRIVSFVTYENKATFQAERMSKYLHKVYEETHSMDKVMELVIDFESYFDEEFANEISREYSEDPEATFKDIMKNGIYIRCLPFGEVNFRDALIEVDERWPEIMKPEKIQVKLRNRWVTIDGDYRIGYQYTWVLKQEGTKQMSVVPTGKTSLYDLPVKTRQFNRHQKHYSDNPVKFGEYDTYNFLSAIGVKQFAKVATYFRGSQYTDNSVLIGQLNDMKIDLSKYNQFPQLDNLKNILELMGVEMRPDIFGPNTVGAIDEEHDIMFGNVNVRISVPDLRYVTIMYSYYLQYDEYKNGVVDMIEFLNNIRGTGLFNGLPEEYIQSVIQKFTELLPVLAQVKEYE